MEPGGQPPGVSLSAAVLCLAGCAGSTEDETIGWVYQYYNDPIERKNPPEMAKLALTFWRKGSKSEVSTPTSKGVRR